MDGNAYIGSQRVEPSTTVHNEGATGSSALVSTNIITSHSIISSMVIVLHEFL